MKIQILEPWNKVTYNEALKVQKSLTQKEEVGWLFFCPPPTITIGKRGHFSDVLIPMDEIKKRGISVQLVDRGGQVTYHGPGQILGFPIGSLKSHIGDSRGVKKFFKKLHDLFSSWIVSEFHLALDLNKDCAGVWLRSQETQIRKKVLAFGMHFSLEGMSHGFALNVHPTLSHAHHVHAPTTEDAFDLIVPCGEVGAKPAYLDPHQKKEMGTVLLSLSNLFKTQW